MTNNARATNQNNNTSTDDTRRTTNVNGSRRSRSEERVPSSLNRTTPHIRQEDLNDTRVSSLGNDSLTERYEELLTEIGLPRQGQSQHTHTFNAQPTQANVMRDHELNSSVTMADIDPQINSDMRELHERNTLLADENEVIRMEVRELQGQKRRMTEMITKLQRKVEKEGKVRKLQDRLNRELKDTVVSKDHVIRNMEREKNETKKNNEERLARITELDELLASKETELVKSLQQLKLTQTEVERLSNEHQGALAKITKETQVFADSAIKVNNLVETKYLNHLKSYKSVEDQVENSAIILIDKFQTIEDGIKSLTDIHNSRSFIAYNNMITSQCMTYQSNSDLNLKMWEDYLKNSNLLKDIEAKTSAKDSSFELYKIAIKKMERSLMVVFMLMGIWLYTSVIRFIGYMF